MMLSAEVLSAFSVYRFSKEYDMRTEDFKQFAYAHAGLRRCVDDNVYQLAQRWHSTQDYNDYWEIQARDWFILMQNNPEGFREWMENNMIDRDDYWWEWSSESKYNEFVKIRRDRQNIELYRNFAVGAMIINRFISVMDVTIFSNRLQNERNHVYSAPDFDRKGISLIYEFKF
jgi:hypothetical protein